MIKELSVVPNAINRFYSKHLYSLAFLKIVVTSMAFPSLLLIFPEAIAFLLISIILLFSNMWMIGIPVTLLFILYISIIMITWHYIRKRQPTSAQFVLIYLTEIIIIIPICIIFLIK